MTAVPMAVVTSTDNASVKAARKLGRKAERDRTGRLLVEGPRAVGEALGSLETLFASAAADPAVVGRARAAGVDVVEVSERVAASVGDTVTSQGLVGVARLSSPALDDVVGGADGADLAVCCVAIADPGNLGTLVRSADAAGATAVVCTRGSVDPRNPKAVRASAGSLFHLPVVADVALPAVLAAARSRGLQVVAADARGSTVFTDVDFARPTLLLLGSEAHGLPDQARRGADVVARVPIHGRAESLNLAATAAVLLYEAARQRALAAQVAP